MKKTTFKIIGMHCTSCAINIDGELEDTDGIKEATTSYAKLETNVSLDEKKIKEADIIGIIKKAGYDATPVNKE